MKRAMRAYDWSLRLLPRASRDRHGDEMTRLFADLHAAARQEGWLPVARLWLAELVGLVRLAVRTRFGNALAELHWAWRGIRHRGWTAALAVGLLAIAMAGNAIVFAAADALVFHRVTYRDADALVEIQNTSTPYPSSRMSADLVDAWAENTDILAGVGGYLQKTIFLQSNGPAELVAAADVTPGTLELLGARAAWGRSLMEPDTRVTDTDVVVVSHELAVTRFGSARAAVGQRLETTDLPLRIVGVMPPCQA